MEQGGSFVNYYCNYTFMWGEHLTHFISNAGGATSEAASALHSLQSSRHRIRRKCLHLCAISIVNHSFPNNYINPIANYLRPFVEVVYTLRLLRESREAGNLKSNVAYLFKNKRLMIAGAACCKNQAG
jgi:hypothetical protein